MMLLWLGYPQRVPYCELEGEAAPKARRAYLSGLDVAFSKSDRSMAVKDKHGAWRLIVDDWWFPALYVSREAALAAARRAELPRKVAPVPAVLAAAREWARERGVHDALEAVSYRRQEGAY